MLSYPWPGNVRELKAEAKRWITLSENKISTESFSEPIIRFLSSSPDGWEGYTLASMEKEMIQRALERNQGNKSKAAQELGIDRTTLYAKMDKYKL